MSQVCGSNLSLLAVQEPKKPEAHSKLALWKQLLLGIMEILEIWNF